MGDVRSTQGVGIATINGAHLHYEVAGAGDPIVLVHAGVADHRMWDDLFVPLAQDHLVLRYDLRGFGASTSPGGPFSHTADLASLLEHVEIDSGTVVGASFGGQVAIELALRHPENVTGLVVADSAIQGWSWSEEVRRFGAAEDDALEAGRLDEAVELNLRMWVDGWGRDVSDVDPGLRKRVGDMQRTAFAKQLLAEAQTPPPGPDEWLDPPAVTRLSEIRARTLVVVGSHDVADFLEISEMLTRTIGNATKVVIEGAAHLPSLEKPDLFLKILRDFVSDESAKATEPSP